ncbi:uncharacterized protein METZ01_LOCUS396063 [marine metagenome]|uniref:Uncharacterized protein n=1 Tax=marine metagenome TaxID=408172 RepID=A0A382V9Q1_9ZZZZ
MCITQFVLFLQRQIIAVIDDTATTVYYQQFF